MQHKKLFIVLATLLGMAVSFGAYGQKITVRGTVTDSEGPVIGAVVSSSGANAVTDLDGAFSINGLRGLFGQKLCRRSGRIQRRRARLLFQHGRCFR